MGTILMEIVNTKKGDNARYLQYERVNFFGIKACMTLLRGFHEDAQAAATSCHEPFIVA
jgi:hypothetical protein